MFSKVSHAIESISKVVVYVIAAIEVVEFAKKRFDEIGNSSVDDEPVQEAVNADD